MQDGASKKRKYNEVERGPNLSYQVILEKMLFDIPAASADQGSRYLDKDFGTSKSPKSTRNARS